MAWTTLAVTPASFVLSGIDFRKRQQHNAVGDREVVKLSCASNNKSLQAGRINLNAGTGAEREVAERGQQHQFAIARPVRLGDQEAFSWKLQDRYEGIIAALFTGIVKRRNDGSGKLKGTRHIVYPCHQRGVVGRFCRPAQGRTDADGRHNRQRRASSAIAVLFGVALLWTSASQAEEIKICDGAADFPTTPIHFDLPYEDPLGRHGQLTGAELTDRRNSVYLQFSCFRENKPKPVLPERDEAIRALYERTRELGMFGQSYHFRTLPRRRFLAVTGERTTAGQRMKVRMEYHFMHGQLLIVVASHKAADARGIDQVEMFLDSFRASQMGGG